MAVTTLHAIVPVLQMATGPVILISGIGLLLLTMTNRLGRAIDRARSLSREPVDEPIERTEAALSAEAGRLVVRNIGDTARIA